MTSPRAIPAVEKLRDGLWSIPVPLPDSSLGYVYVYLFETDAGAYIVDAGWNTDEAFAALTAGLEIAGYGIGDLRGVMVTHIHPDHYGLAGRLREASGAWIALHPADAALIEDRYVEPTDLLSRMDDMLRRAGAPADELQSLTQAAMPVRSRVEAVKPDVLLDDGERPEIPGWDLTSIWTPGHSPGHLCFWEPRHQVMLSGDHVLPRITPNIPFHPQAGIDPLGDYLRSLEKLRSYEATEVLPAHEYRFVSLGDRLDALVDHHGQRFAEVLAAIDDGVTSSWHIAARMRWSRPWEQIAGFMRRSAVAEAMAHLRALEIRGLIREEPGEPSRWERVDTAAAATPRDHHTT